MVNPLTGSVMILGQLKLGLCDDTSSVATLTSSSMLIEHMFSGESMIFSSAMDSGCAAHDEQRSESRLTLLKCLKNCVSGPQNSFE